MVVGTMEAKHAWMDEGFVSYWDEISQAALWGEPTPRWGETGRYLRVAGTEEEVPIMRHTDLVNPYGDRGLAAYTKPAVVLGALRSVVGDSVFLGAFRELYRSWEYRHPQPWDFFHTVERHAGRDLDWFWRPLLFETATLDHGVGGVRLEGGRSRIRLVDRGGVVLPTPVR
ncbi:MAG: M1 family peptidase, partial [Gemmatimonadetes bacterium]|nr:M1 family peptidase [Gemmatimonadota bacterium]